MLRHGLRDPAGIDGSRGAANLRSVSDYPAGADDEAVDDAGAPVVPAAAAAAADGVANMRPEIVAISWSPPLNGPVDAFAGFAPPLVLVLALAAPAALVLGDSCRLSTTINRFIDASRPR
jgi:hypothetical protein